jgi:23S rRNA (cytidine2498-2'-O)-methyltransferase
VSGLLCLCRQGFEPELAGELTERAAHAGVAGYARAQRNDGYVLFATDDAAALSKALPWRGLIFARQKLVVLAELPQLDPSDRITPILAALEGQQRFGDMWVEHPDSDAGKPLAGLARAFGNALRPALRKAGLLTDKPHSGLPRLHVVFVDGRHAFVCVADTRDSAPWPLGIPRLKLLPEAPSRSALKLDEALLTLMSPDEREKLVKPGMRAADLGAAPGGWTWVLTRQHMHVISVDNGPLREHVLQTGMATWFREGWCRHAIFNLKLPMKKRWDETRLCLELFEAQAGRPVNVRAKQLYHDREEITVLAW